MLVTLLANFGGPKDSLSAEWIVKQANSGLPRPLLAEKKSGWGNLASPNGLRQTWRTGVPRSLEIASFQDPTVGLCLWPYGGPRGGGGFS